MIFELGFTQNAHSHSDGRGFTELRCFPSYLRRSRKRTELFRLHFSFRTVRYGSALSTDVFLQALSHIGCSKSCSDIDYIFRFSFTFNPTAVHAIRKHSCELVLISFSTNTPARQCHLWWFATFTPIDWIGLIQSLAFWSLWCDTRNRMWLLRHS
jgi:hypothetical protein